MTAVAILVPGALVGDDLVDQPLLLQPLQVAVYGGQSHPAALTVEPLGQFRRAGAIGTVLDAAQDLPLLPCHIGDGHTVASNLKMKIIFKL